MATAKLTKLSLDVEVTLTLTEVEVRALDGIFGYDVEAFLRAFKEKMGSHYVERYENGVRSLHKTIRGTVSGPLSTIDEARKRLRGESA